MEKSEKIKYIILGLLTMTLIIFIAKSTYNNRGWEIENICSKYSAIQPKLFESGGEFYNCDLIECEDVRKEYGVNTEVQRCKCDRNGLYTEIFCEDRTQLIKLKKSEIDKMRTIKEREEQ